MLDKSALIIDDSATARTMLKHKLKKFDVMVESAVDGFDALHLLQTHQPDVIFLDHIMPGMDGFQVLEQLKSNPSTEAIPVVMYTSQAAPKYTIEAMALGAVGVMPKQVSNTLLSQMLDRAERYQQGLIYNDSHRAEAAVVSLAPVKPLPEIVDSEASATDLPGEVSSENVLDQAPEASLPHIAKSAPPVLSLLMLVVLTVQAYSLFRDQQQQQLIGSLENEIAYQQQQYRQVSSELSEQREASQASQEQFQFLMDAVVSEVLDNNTKLQEMPTDSLYEQPESIEQTLALVSE